MNSPKTATKKVINNPESCVDDNLRGVVAACPALHLHPKHRVVTLNNKTDSGRVAVLGGGGSGHEPFASGLLGSGMLDGAVAGGVFASPPTGNVLYAIAHLAKYNSGGVLVILGNYTGDRLNFGKAIEKARIAGIRVEGVIVGEDVASSHNKTGGRSMCGEVFFFKLCGALAGRKYDLLAIKNMALEINSNMATLGVCLNACSLPGQPELFEIGEDELELGAGVHGEAGIEKLKMGTAKEIVDIILDRVTSHLKLVAGHRVAVMINNLGGTSFMEMNIISAEIKDYLENKQIQAERIYTGHYKTSLEMHGFQICLLHLNQIHGDLWLELLDDQTDAGGWTGGPLSRGEGGVEDDETLLQTYSGHTISSGPTLSAEEEELLRGSLHAAATQLVNHEQLLNQLDSGCGDGDCGQTLKKFALAILSYMERTFLDRPARLLWDLAELAEADMGGTSGGIYSLGLAAASEAYSKATSNDRTAWLSAWKNAMASISKYGGADPGDRTMLDTLHTSYLAFEKHQDKPLKELLIKIIQASVKGSKETAHMVARAGRASYVSAHYTRAEDAGARAVSLWLSAALAHILHTL